MCIRDRNQGGDEGKSRLILEYPGLCSLDGVFLDKDLSALLQLDRYILHSLTIEQVGTELIKLCQLHIKLTYSNR